MDTDYKPFEKQERKISENSLKLISDYFNRIAKRSTKSVSSQRGQIEKCIDFINKPIHLINKRDLLDYIELNIENRNISIITKENYCRFLKSFFESMVFINELDVNPVSSVKMLKRQGLLTFNEKRDKTENPFLEKDQEIFEENELLEILRLSKGRDLTDFIIFGLLISTGARISEIITIRTNHIDFVKSMFYTGEEDGARKSTLKNFNKRGQRGIYFSFPENFGHYIKQYKQLKGRKDDDFLFQGTRKDKKTEKYKHYHYNSFRLKAERRYGKKWTLFHKYRKTLITLRVKNKNCPLEISKLLVNHQTSDVEVNHYIKFSLEDKRDLYKTYFPFEQFPYF